jgi:CO2 hydration protein (ChpXY)
MITTKINPSTHEFATVIHRLEAGGAMLPDTPENLMQIIGLYKAYAVPMDFYWRFTVYCRAGISKSVTSF